MADLHDTVTVMCGEITEDMAGKNVVVAGMVTYVRRLTTKKGDPMAFAGLEDLQGTTEIVIFPRTWKQAESICQPDKILVVRGKVDGSGKQPKILAESITDQISVARPADEVQMPQPAVVTQRPRPKPSQIKEPEPTWNIDPDMPPPPPDDWWPEDTAPVKPVATAGRRPQTTDHSLKEIGNRPSPSGELQQTAASDATQPNGNGSQARAAKPKGNGMQTADRGAPTTEHSPLNTAHSSPANSRPRRLTITLARSNDQAHDMQLLSEVHRLLTSRQGRDRFMFRVTGSGNGAYEIDFPNHYTRFSPDLVSALEGMLGSGTVRVEMQ
jgi:DNA polymerase-3 subunit alpha